MEELKEKIDKHIAKEGIKMSKCVDPGYYGIFSSRPARYDEKTARSYKEACDLDDNGYRPTNNVGITVLNALME